MSRHYGIGIFKVAMVGILVWAPMSACSKAQKPDTTESINSASADENASGDSDSGKAGGLQTVHFAYDSLLLDSEAKKVLRSDVEILKSKPKLQIQVEGHCDQRGGIQYNIGLGEKRANVVRHFLAGLGVPENRITVISFGKERPIDTAETEEAYAKNRRANFVVTKQ